MNVVVATARRIATSSAIELYVLYSFVTYASAASPDGHSPLAGAPLMSQLSPEARLELEESAEEVLLSAGETLFVAGDVADVAYSLVSGRLEVAVDGSAVRLLGPGAVLGELALLTSGTRSATVRARRDSVLLRLRPAALLTVMEQHPAAGGAVARVLAHQLAHPASPPRRREGSRTVAVVGLHRGAPAAEVAAALSTCLAQHGSVVAPGPVDAAGLARVEQDHDVVLLVAADPDGQPDSQPGTDPGWWARAVRQADRVIAVATTAMQPTDARPALPPAATWSLVGMAVPDDRLATWVAALDAWQVTSVAEVSPSRYARWPPAPAAVPSASPWPGGARALVHCGLLAALEEADVPVDRVSGCSVGGIVAGLHATGDVRGGDEGDPVRRVRAPQAVLRLHRAAGLVAKGQRVGPRWSEPSATAASRGCPCSALCEHRPDLAERPCAPARQRRRRAAGHHRAARAVPAGGPRRPAAGRRRRARQPARRPPARARRGAGGGRQRGMGGSDGTSARDPSRPPRVPALGETLLRTMLIGSGGATAGATAAGLVVVTPPALGVGLLEFHQFDAVYDAGLATGRQLVAGGG